MSGTDLRMCCQAFLAKYKLQHIFRGYGPYLPTRAIRAVQPWCSPATGLVWSSLYLVKGAENEGSRGRHEAQKMGVGVSKGNRLTTIFSTSKDHFQVSLGRKKETREKKEKTFQVETKRMRAEV
eukprot:3249252-Rhodomonas_salina.1